MRETHERMNTYMCTTTHVREETTFSVSDSCSCTNHKQLLNDHKVKKLNDAEIRVFFAEQSYGLCSACTCTNTQADTHTHTPHNPSFRN